jgi:hypothetical protein
MQSNIPNLYAFGAVAPTKPKAMRGRIALLKHSCEMTTTLFLFREAFGVRTRPRVALAQPTFLGGVNDLLSVRSA